MVGVLDVDDRPCKRFLNELRVLLQACRPAPKKTMFRLAIEEMEAWLLGDRAAITLAYPRAKRKVLDAYQQDSVCGTWEILADCIYSGGRQALQREGHSEVGRSKSEWAKRIGGRMNIEANRSPSFQQFRSGVRRLLNDTGS